MGSRMLSDTGYRGVCIQSMGNFDDDISKGLEEKTVSGIILARTSTGYICRKVLILKGEKMITDQELKRIENFITKEDARMEFNEVQAIIKMLYETYLSIQKMKGEELCQ